MRFATLRRKPNRAKRIAFLLTNAPGKAARIGNAVGRLLRESSFRQNARRIGAAIAAAPGPAGVDGVLRDLVVGKTPGLPTSIDRKTS